MDWPCLRPTPPPVSGRGHSAVPLPGGRSKGVQASIVGCRHTATAITPDQGDGMSRDVAEGHPVGGRSWVIPTRQETPIRPLSAWARTVEVLTRRHAECIQLEARIRRARRELGSTSSDGLQRTLVEIEADLRTYARLLAEHEVRMGWAGALPVPCGVGGISDVPLGAAITEFVRRSRGDVPEAERLGDAESVGVLAEIARVAETWLWDLTTVPDKVRISRPPCSEAIR